MIAILLVLFCVSGVQGYVNVSISALPYLIMTRKFDILMDVRTPEEYNEGHVPTAVLVPVLNITDILDAGAYREYANLTVGVTCRTGRRSTIASEIMENDYGFSDLINIVGGWRDWSSNCSALPYETGDGECILCGEEELANA
eukprot:TRINITY_DN10383_c0_g2_i1.p5 TRINITY_DN10383_c0_g2~~TRINITY_DN10383_c0_g2_i1.p5  ORF type:complete len:143 (-),score=29.18 TRINITY_DN10383_c0_g2_i1:824-1252(-)